MGAGVPRADPREGDMSFPVCLAHLLWGSEGKHGDPRCHITSKDWCECHHLHSQENFRISGTMQVIFEAVGHLLRESMKRVSLSLSPPKTLGGAFCPGL